MNILKICVKSCEKRADPDIYVEDYIEYINRSIPVMNQLNRKFRENLVDMDDHSSDCDGSSSSTDIHGITEITEYQDSAEKSSSEEYSGKISLVSSTDDVDYRTVNVGGCSMNIPDYIADICNLSGIIVEITDPVPCFFIDRDPGLFKNIMDLVEKYSGNIAGIIDNICDVPIVLVSEMSSYGIIPESYLPESKINIRRTPIFYEPDAETVVIVSEKSKISLITYHKNLLCSDIIEKSDGRGIIMVDDDIDDLRILVNLLRHGKSVICTRRILGILDKYSVPYYFPDVPVDHEILDSIYEEFDGDFTDDRIFQADGHIDFDHDILFHIDANNHALTNLAACIDIPVENSPCGKKDGLATEWGYNSNYEDLIVKYARIFHVSNGKRVLVSETNQFNIDIISKIYPSETCVKIPTKIYYRKTSVKIIRILVPLHILCGTGIIGNKFQLEIRLAKYSDIINTSDFKLPLLNICVFGTVRNQRSHNNKPMISRQINIVEIIKKERYSYYILDLKQYGDIREVWIRTKNGAKQICGLYEIILRNDEKSINAKFGGSILRYHAPYAKYKYIAEPGLYYFGMSGGYLKSKIRFLKIKLDAIVDRVELLINK